MLSNAAGLADSPALYACLSLCVSLSAAIIEDSAAMYACLSLCMPSDACMYVCMALSCMIAMIAGCAL